MNLHVALPDLQASERFGRALAAVLRPPLLVGLRGDLGAGKTTLVRALVNTLLPGTRVKSPTYNLLESYDLPGGPLHHMDLYRLDSPDELAALGLDELLADDALALVEWPEKGRPVLPGSDLDIELRHRDNGREAILQGSGPRVEAIIAELAQLLKI